MKSTKPDFYKRLTAPALLKIVRRRLGLFAVNRSIPSTVAIAVAAGVATTGVTFCVELTIN